MVIFIYFIYLFAWKRWYWRAALESLNLTLDFLGLPFGSVQPSGLARRRKQYQPTRPRVTGPTSSFPILTHPGPRRNHLLRWRGTFHRARCHSTRQVGVARRSAGGGARELARGDGPTAKRWSPRRRRASPPVEVFSPVIASPFSLFPSRLRHARVYSRPKVLWFATPSMSLTCLSFARWWLNGKLETVMNCSVSCDCELGLLKRLVVFGQYGLDDATVVPRFLILFAVSYCLWNDFVWSDKECLRKWISQLAMVLGIQKFCPNVGRCTALIQYEVYATISECSLISSECSLE